MSIIPMAFYKKSELCKFKIKNIGGRSPIIVNFSGKDQMSVTIADYEAIQEQVIKFRKENEELKEQINAAKKRQAMTSAQLQEEIKSNIVELKVSKSQLIREQQATVERIKLSQLQNYLETKNILEETEIPAVKSLPDKLKGIATEVLKLVDEYKEQVARKVFFDTQASDLNRKTKSLEKTGEQLQAKVQELRDKQKQETEEVAQKNFELQKQEQETRRLRELISAANAPRSAQLTPENLSRLKKRVKDVEEGIEKKKENHKKFVDEITAKIEAHNRTLEDAQATMKLIPKKNQQKIKALQDEINKRRGVVVHQGKDGTHDANELFKRSKKLIDGIATMQQENWNLEERVAFSRNSVTKMATEIVKVMFGTKSDPKTAQLKSNAHNFIMKIAEIERYKRKKANKNKK